MQSLKNGVYRRTILELKPDKEYLFQNFGLDNRSSDDEKLTKEKKIFRGMTSKMMKTQIRRENAVGIMKNFNKIK